MNKEAKQRTAILLFIGIVSLLFLSIYHISAKDFNVNGLSNTITDYDGNVVDSSSPYIWKRTASSETYKNPDGTYTLSLGQSIRFLDDKTKNNPHYVDFNDTFFSLINSTNQLYDYELNQYYEPGFNIYFKINPTQGQVVKYIVNDTEITFQPMALNYRNNLNQLEQINMIKNVVGEEDVNRFVYPNAYGNGLNLTYESKLGTMKENLIINSFSDLITPSQYIIDGGNTTLDLDFIISTNSKIIINGAEWDKKNSAKSRSSVKIQNQNGKTLYNLPSPIITDSVGNLTFGEYEFKKSGNSLYVILKTPYEFLENAIYPVFIDPTITIQDPDTENLEDTYVASANTYTNYGPSTLLYQRGPGQTENSNTYFKFDISQIIGTVDSIQSASLDLWGSTGTAWVNGVINMSVYGFDNLVWTEGYGTTDGSEISWVNEPSGSKTYQSSDTVDDYFEGEGIKHFDVYNWVNNSFNNLDTAVSFYINDTTTGLYHWYWYSKEYPESAKRAYLTITYTPGLTATSPTPWTVFDDDTVQNVTMGVTSTLDMSSCHYNINGGSTNYSMTNITDYKTWTAEAEALPDGKNYVTFSCNKSSDGIWLPHTDEVYFTIDPINVSICRDLTVSNRDYKMINNITSTAYDDVPCFEFSGDSSNLSMNGYTLTGDNDGIGVYVDATDVARDDIWIKNGTIKNFNEAIYFKETERNSLEDLTLSDSIYSNVYYSDNDNSKILNCNILNSGSYGLFTYDSFGLIMNNSYINNSGDKGIYIHELNGPGSGGNIYNSIIENSLSYEVYVEDEVRVNITNTTYSTDNEGLSTGDYYLKRKWYFDANVTDASKSPLQGVAINITDALGSKVFSNFTDSNGDIDRTQLIEYTLNSTNRTYETSHTVNVSLNDYVTNSTLYNITIDKNIFAQYELKSILTVSLNTPENISTQTTPTSFNCSSIAGANDLVNSTLYIWNSTGSLYNQTTTNISGLSNESITSINFTYDDTFTWNCLVYNNISESKWADSNYTVYISTLSPAINLNYPTDNSWLNNDTNIYFNFTAIDNDGLDTCELWGNFTGNWSKNYTWENPVSGVQNFTILNLTDNSYNWNIWCNDTLGDEGFSTNNYTVNVDTVYPEISILSITTTKGSQTISFTNNVSDANLDSCKYSIFDSNGTIDGTNENVSFTCNSSSQATVTTFGTYNLTIYATDFAGNENSSTSQFTTSAATTDGGGGGAAVTVGAGILEATNFSITTRNFRSNMDISLAKDSVKERRKNFIITNEGIDPIEVEIFCSTENSTDSSFIEGNLSICDFVKISNTTAIISAIEENRFEGYFEILPPTNSTIGDEFFFNIFVIREIDEEQRFSKLSVSARLTSIAVLSKWSYIPGQKDEDEEKNSYPVWVVALLLSLTLFISIVAIFRRKKLILSGFFIGLVIFIISFILLLIVL